MSNTLYNGTPVEQVDFEAEFNKELALLTEKINDLKARKRMKDIRNKNFEYWAIKLNRANKALDVGQATLD